MAFWNTSRLFLQRNLLVPLIRSPPLSQRLRSSSAVCQPHWNSSLCFHSRSVHEQSANAVARTKVDTPLDSSPSPADTVDEATREIQNLDPETGRKLKIIQMEHAVWQSLGKRVPDNMTDKLWLHMLYKLETRSQRFKYYGYLHHTEKCVLAEKKKKEKKRIEREQKFLEKNAAVESGEYEQRYTNMLYVRNQTMNMCYYNNIFYAMMNGPHIVFDMGYSAYMKTQQIMSLYTQLLFVINANKISRQPFHMHLCNVDEEEMGDTLTRRIGGIEKMPVTVSQESYLEHYPKDKLVYLTPDSPNVLREINYDEVYIIGGLVDCGREDPLSYAKAKKEGIRSAKLPLDYYLRWKMGTKALTLDQMMKILLTASETNNDWDKAFKHVPTRKL